MSLGYALLLTVTGVLIVTTVSVVGLLIQDWRRSPEEKARRVRAWNEMELAGALTLALDRAEDLEHVDLLAIFENALSSDDREERPSEVQTLRERLAAIERRFPDEATVDKIASANDAILATKVEALEQEVSRLRDDALQRWDVALVLFGVLGSIAAVVGIVLGAARYLA